MGIGGVMSFKIDNCDISQVNQECLWLSVQNLHKNPLTFSGRLEQIKVYFVMSYQRESR